MNNVNFESVRTQISNLSDLIKKIAKLCKLSSENTNFSGEKKNKFADLEETKRGVISAN